MGRVDEEHATFTGLVAARTGFSLVSRKAAWSATCSAKFFFGGTGDRTDPVKLQAQILFSRKFCTRPGPVVQPGQLKDAIARLGDGRGWLLLGGVRINSR